METTEKFRTALEDDFKSGAVDPATRDQEIGSERKVLLRRRLTLLAGIVAGAVACIGGFLWWQHLCNFQETDNAYVEAHITGVSSKVGGQILNVYVDDNQIVKAGQLLAQVDPIDYQVKVDRCKAAVDLARQQVAVSRAAVSQVDTSASAQTDQAQGDVSAARAEVEAALSRLSESESAVEQQRSQLKALAVQERQSAVDLQRYEALDAQGGVSKQELDHVRTTHECAVAQLQSGKDLLKQCEHKVLEARAAVEQSRGRLARAVGSIHAAVAAHKQTEVSEEQVELNAAALRQAATDLRDAELKLSYTEIRAPIAGRIGRKSLEVGQRIEVGQSLLAIVAPEPWVTANFKETQVEKMHPGQEAEVKVDSMPGVTLRARVESLSPASGAKFALLPPENATGNFTKIVQRIPVKLIFDAGSPSAHKARIAPGMSCEVAVRVAGAVK